MDIDTVKGIADIVRRFVNKNSELHHCRSMIHGKGIGLRCSIEVRRLENYG